VSTVSLRARLVIGALVLVTLGLGAFGTGTYTALRAFLAKRTDRQLTALARPVTSAVSAVRVGTGTAPGRVRDVAGPGVWVQVRAPDGAVTTVVAPGPRDGMGPPPRLPASFPASEGATAAAPANGRKARKPRVVLLSVSADGPGPRYRVAATPLPDGQGTLVIAASLGPTDQTLGRLLAVEGVVGLVVLVATALLGLLLAGQAARPLERIAVTADAIAAGDMGRRVAGAGPRTELGRVGVALNAMLDRIQDGFARRDATEERLRRFIADASHELATPLTSIQGYAELFERGAVSSHEDLTKAMSRIRSEASRMGGLIDDLLLLAALDAGRPVRQGPLDLARVGADAVDDARAVEPGRPFELEAPRPVVVMGDEDRLRQVAANLTATTRPLARQSPSGCTARGAAACSRWWTTGGEWPPARQPGHSTGSGAPTTLVRATAAVPPPAPAPRAPAALAWAWPSSPPSLAPTEVERWSRQRRVGEPPSASRSRWPPPPLLPPQVLSLGPHLHPSPRSPQASGVDMVGASVPAANSPICELCAAPRGARRPSTSWCSRASSRGPTSW